MCESRATNQCGETAKIWTSLLIQESDGAHLAVSGTSGPERLVFSVLEHTRAGRCETHKYFSRRTMESKRITPTAKAAA